MFRQKKPSTQPPSCEECDIPTPQELQKPNLGAGNCYPNIISRNDITTLHELDRWAFTRCRLRSTWHFELRPALFVGRRRFLHRLCGLSQTLCQIDGPVKRSGQNAGQFAKAPCESKSLKGGRGGSAVKPKNEGDACASPFRSKNELAFLLLCGFLALLCCLFGCHGFLFSLPFVMEHCDPTFIAIC
jgi:hypothetical protein